jgi:uncharacterized UPF0146 family protein
MNPLFIMGGIQMGADLLGGLAKKKAMKQAEREYNQMARERNKAVLAETARNIGELNRQRTVLNMQTNQALFHTGQSADTARSDLSVLQGVTDSIGSTSQVLLSDVERQEAEAKAVVVQNLETEQFNLNASLDTLVNSSISQYSGIKYGASSQANREIMGKLLGTSIDVGATAYTQGLFSSKPETKQVSSVGMQGLQLAMASKR